MICCVMQKYFDARCNLHHVLRGKCHLQNLNAGLESSPNGSRMTPGRSKERPPGGLTRYQDGFVRTSLLTHISNHSSTYLLTYLLAYSPIFVFNYIFTLLTYLLNDIHTCSSLPITIYLLTHVFANSLTDCTHGL